MYVNTCQSYQLQSLFVSTLERMHSVSIAVITRPQTKFSSCTVVNNRLNNQRLTRLISVSGSVFTQSLFLQLALPHTGLREGLCHINITIFPNNLTLSSLIWWYDMSQRLHHHPGFDLGHCLQVWPWSSLNRPRLMKVRVPMSFDHDFSDSIPFYGLNNTHTQKRKITK